MKKEYIYGLLAIFFWSTAATAFKIALKNIDFIQLLFYSSFISFIILLITLLVQNKFQEIFCFSAKQYATSALVSVLNPFGYYLILLKAYSILPAQIAQPLNYTWPIMLVILSVPFLHQKMTFKNIAAVFISFCGVFVISSQGNIGNFHFTNPFGVALASGSSVVWAMYWIFNVRDKRDEIIKLFFNFLFGTIYIGISVLLFSSFYIKSSEVVLPVIWVGCFEMGFTFVLWLKALQLSKNNAKISNLVFLSPFLSLLFIHLILGEQIYFTTLIGLVIIILGIIVNGKL